MGPLKKYDLLRPIMFLSKPYPQCPLLLQTSPFFSEVTFAPPTNREMGKKAKTSRKGKKAWRANISTEDIEDFFEKTTKDALSGGNLSAASNEDLFHVEKSHGYPLHLSH